jgi:hypothetical protein
MLCQADGMGLLCHYFAAGDDDEGSSVIDETLGPGPDGQGAYDVIVADRIEPVVILGQLDALLRGVPYQELARAGDGTEIIAAGDDGERLVVRLPDAFRDALVGADVAGFPSLAAEWAQIEEFWGAADPGDLEAGMLRLRGLAERARSRSHHLYCWMCV